MVTARLELCSAENQPSDACPIVFGHVFDIRTAAGECAHTGCIGFGVERVVIALFKQHGLAPERWPEAVRARLGA